jgi:hypothetical protein
MLGVFVAVFVVVVFVFVFVVIVVFPGVVRVSVCAAALGPRFSLLVSHRALLVSISTPVAPRVLTTSFFGHQTLLFCFGFWFFFPSLFFYASVWLLCFVVIVVARVLVFLRLMKDSEHCCSCFFGSWTLFPELFFPQIIFFFCESISPVISTLILCRFQQELHEPQQRSDWLELILSQEQ